MSFRVRVSPLEKEYVFDMLDSYGIGYVKEEFYIWYCGICGKVYKEKVAICTGLNCDNTDMERVQVGDFIGWTYNYIIERKKESDLLSSLHDNRLYIQLKNMAELFHRNCALVFEGRFEDVIEKEMDRIKLLRFNGTDGKTIGGATARLKQLMSIPAECFQYGISFIQVRDLDQLLKMLKYFDYKCGTAPTLRTKRSSIAKDLPKFLRLLMGIEGMGIKYSTLIYDQYRDASALIPALENGDLHKTVKGIGVKREELIRKWFLND